jgi:hypothetical protein
MKNKRGFLLGEETVKIIIAVICLVVLVYFLVSLYLANKDKDLELAKASLEHLVADINSGKTETEIYNPQKNWFIGSYPRGEIMPELCLNKDWEKCLCICFYPKNCDSKDQGDCQESDFTVENIAYIANVAPVEHVIMIKDPPIRLTLKNKQITISE